MSHTNRWLVISLVLVVSGCGVASRSSAPDRAVARTEPNGMPLVQSAIESRSWHPAESEANNSAAAVSGQEPTTQLPVQPLDRKIIYTASLRVRVPNFDGVPEKVIELVDSFGGYISETRVGQLQGTKRSATWKIRIPVNHYRTFLRSAGGIGVPESVTENAQDVSEEFVDLEARVSSARKLEENVMKLLDRESGKIEDLVAVERELARIRLDIERMEGRTRFLENQVALSTVDLHISEQVTFVAAEQPGLAKRVQIEWIEALGRLNRFYERTVLNVVANTFVIIAWIVFVLLATAIFSRIRRRLRRNRPAAAATT